MTTKLPIAETFDTIQGEGSLLGVPSFFIRTAGCNLRCTWCDTPYASWDAAGDQRSVASLVEEVQRCGRKHVVLTGGEPLMFPGLVDLNDALREAGCHVTVETAGTLALPLTCDLLSCSPKLSNSTPANDPRDPSGKWAERHESRRWRPEILSKLIQQSVRTQWKFVVSNPQDLAEIDQMLAEVPPERPEDVFLMPEGVEVPESERVRWIVQLCQERGWCYGHRLHIALFGNTRGT